MLSDDIVGIASQILGMSQRLKNREISEFLQASPRQRAVVAEALVLSEARVQALIAADEEFSPPATPGGPTKKRQIWEYDTRTATVEDLSRRLALLRDRLRVLEYLRVK